MPRRDPRAGFTMVELVVVCLIIGILAAFAIPQYVKTVETTKADDAVALLNQIGTLHKMYALDHDGVYIANDSFPVTLVGCASDPTCGTVAARPSCQLVACKYLQEQDWFSAPYTYSVTDPAASGGVVASCQRKTGGGGVGTDDPTYSAWGYTINKDGQITPVGGAPAPTY